MAKKQELATVERQKAQMVNSADAKQYLDYNKYNPIFYTDSVFNYLPEGVSMVPNVITIPDRDIWDKAKDNKLGFLKDGQVMLSANAISRIAQAAGIKLERVTDDVISASKTDEKGNVYNYNVLRIEYKASMMLPDGTVIEEVGGKEEIYTPGHGHGREKIDTKARRNALKRLMNLPTTMDRDEVKKPMVVFKTLFQRGGQVDHVVDAMEASQGKAVAALYGTTAVQDPAIIDVEPNNPHGVETVGDDISSYVDAMARATTIEELKAVGEDIAATDVTQEAHDKLVEAYKARQVELTTPKQPVGTGQPTF